MLRYKTETRPGLVALYNIRPGNGAGPFLQPRSPHGAMLLCDIVIVCEQHLLCEIQMVSSRNCDIFMVSSMP